MSTNGPPEFEDRSAQREGSPGNTGALPSMSARDRRPYRSPTLRVFGKVSALTQSASGCAQADNPGCSSPPLNMGPIPRLQR